MEDRVHWAHTASSAWKIFLERREEYSLPAPIDLHSLVSRKHVDYCCGFCVFVCLFVFNSVLGVHSQSGIVLFCSCKILLDVTLF